MATQRTLKRVSRCHLAFIFALLLLSSSSSRRLPPSGLQMGWMASLQLSRPSSWAGRPWARSSRPTPSKACWTITSMRCMTFPSMPTRPRSVRRRHKKKTATVSVQVNGNCVSFRSRLILDVWIDEEKSPSILYLCRFYIIFLSCLESFSSLFWLLSIYRHHIKKAGSLLSLVPRLISSMSL